MNEHNQPDQSTLNQVAPNGTLHHQAQEALRQSEEKYRRLFETMATGFAIHEAIRDENGQLINYRLLELNPAFEKLTGLQANQAVGKTILDILPGHDPWWFTTFHQLLESKETLNIEQFLPQLNRWYDMTVFYYREEQFAAYYSDITERKRQQVNLAFLAEVSRDLVHLKTIAETMNALGAKIGHHFTATRCAFFEYNEAMDEQGGLAALCEYDWHQVNEPSLVGSYRTADFYTADFLQTMHAGEAFVVNDREADPRADATNLAALNIASCIVIPIVTSRESRFLLCITDTVPRHWHDDEIDLMRELTTRIWTRLERVHAEEALRQSEARFRALATVGSSSVYFMSPDWGEMRQLDGAGFLVNTQEPTSSWINTYIPSDEQPRVRQAIQRAIRAKDVFELEHRVLSADGTVGWTFSRAIPLLDQNGQIAEWFGAATDVTARVKADQRFTRLFQAAPALFLVVQPDAPRFTITEVNDAYLAATMRTREEVVGRGIFEAYPDNPHEATRGGVSALRASLERVLASHQPDHLPGLQYDIARPDGRFEQRWWSPVNSPVLNENGQVEAIIHNANDVTEERRSQQVLQESEERQAFLLKLSDALRPLSDSAQMECTAMQVLGQQLGVNRAFFATIEADGESWSIRHDYTDGVASQVGRYPMSQFQRSRLSQWQAGLMSSITDSETDAGLSPADRAAYAVLGTRAAIGVPLVKGGRFAALLSVNQTVPRDWTEVELALTREAAERTWVAIEAAKAEEALQASLKRFESIANLVPDLLWDSAPDGATNWYNQRWLAYTGQRFDEAIGWGWLDAIHPDDREASAKRYDEAVEIGQSLRQEHRIRRHDGAYRWFVVSASPITDQTGQVVNMYGAATDIHDHKHLEATLLVADRRKDEFLAMLAHELRNPMSTIRSGLQILSLATDDEKTTHVTLAMINRQTDHLVRLVDDLLDVSRISQGKIELRKERVNVVDLMSQAAQAIDSLYQQQGRHLTVDLPASPIYVEGDATRLAQVVTNLLTNGLRYTRPGGRVWLSLEHRDDEAILNVRDNGIGLGKDQLSAIFELFVQVDNSLGRAQGGLGLGLTLVKRLVELHGGRVDAQSEGLGKGSLFTVHLPTLSKAAEPRPDVKQEPTNRPAKPRLLVVDDNPDAALTMGMLLRLNGYEVYTRHSGQASIEAAESLQPTAILLDIGMPDMDGYDTCRLIRQQSWGGAITLIALTGYGQDQDRQRTQAAGFDGHLVKPVDIAVLLKLVTELTSQKKITSAAS